MDHRQRLGAFDAAGNQVYQDQLVFFKDAFLRDIKTIQNADCAEFAKDFLKNLVGFKRSFRENAPKMWIGDLASSIDSLVLAFESSKDADKATVLFYSLKAIALDFIDRGHFQILHKKIPQLLSFIDKEEIDGSRVDNPQSKNRIDKIKPYILKIDYEEMMDLFAKYHGYKADFIPLLDNYEGLTYLCRKKFPNHDSESTAKAIFEQLEIFPEYLSQKPRPPKTVQDYQLRQASQSSISARTSLPSESDLRSPTIDAEPLENDVFVGEFIPATPLPAESEFAEPSEQAAAKQSEGESFVYNLETDAELIGAGLLEQIEKGPSKTISGKANLSKSLSAPQFTTHKT